jgi:HAD superfamily hydrolase (TIGR01490 family)
VAGFESWPEGFTYLDAALRSGSTHARHLSGPTMAAQNAFSPSDRVSVAAFFDVDNTLLPGRPIELRFVGHLLAQRQIGAVEALRSCCHLLKHIPPVSLQPLRERKLYLEGKQPSIIEPLAKAFVVNTICRRVSSPALAAVARHRDAGHHLVLITASLDFLIGPLALFLKIDTVLAARPERISDRYTGRLLSLPYADGKREIITQLSTQQGLDLRYSYAYGDSPGDLETLRSVGFPVVVNPIRGMSRIAAREGWPVERWD